MSKYEVEMIKELVDELLDAGYVVYLAERGTYGFYTDESGERVVSFSVSLGIISWSGNYISQPGSGMGTGWAMERDTFHRMLHARPPYWAVRSNTSWWYASVEDELGRYNESSRYTRLEGKQ